MSAQGPINQPAAAGPGNQGIAPLKPGQTGAQVNTGDLQVAALGDSLMWGQGLNRNDRFSARFAAALNAKVGKPGVLVWDSARSGAEIQASDIARAGFPDIYPKLFTRPGRTKFLNNSDESEALGLYGEIPAPFPSILGQVRMLQLSGMGKNIDIALVDGGMNDVGVEDIVNPQVREGHPVQDYDHHIYDIGYTRVVSLLQAVRDQCPKAVILYFGFYPGASYESSTKKIKAYAKYEHDSDVTWYLNEVAGCTDTDKLIHEVQTRGLWFQGRWQYWSRQAVNYMAMDTKRRGPGVVFVPSTFGPENSGYAPKSFLWQNYDPPVNDDAMTRRLQEIPRYQHLTALQALHATILLGSSTARALATQLEPLLDGPVDVTTNLRDFNNGQNGAAELTWEALGQEVHRIQHGVIASFTHPNRAGAKAYAESALTRYKDHLDTQAALTQEEQQHGPGPYTPLPRARTTAPLPPAAAHGPLDTLLTECHLRTSYLPLADDVHHLNVDSLAVVAKTASTSERNLGVSFWLALVLPNPILVRPMPRYYLLTFKPYITSKTDVATGVTDPASRWFPYFDRGTTNRFTVDTRGDVKLEDVISSALVLGPDPWPDMGASVHAEYGLNWYPETVTLEVNGVAVSKLDLLGQSFGPRSRIDLNWPDPVTAMSAISAPRLPSRERVGHTLPGGSKTPRLPARRTP